MNICIKSSNTGASSISCADPYLFCSGEGEEAIGVAKVHPLDMDSDGMSDDDENTAGTDPGDSSSVFQVESAFSTEPYSIRWFSASGRTYQVEYSTNLSSWIHLHRNITATPPTNQQSVAAAPDDAGGFFQLAVEQ